MRPRPVFHETEAETKTNYCETETEIDTKKWFRDHAGLETLPSMANTKHEYQTELTPAGFTTRLKLTFCLLITVDVIVVRVRGGPKLCVGGRRRVWSTS